MEQEDKNLPLGNQEPRKGLYKEIHIPEKIVIRKLPIKVIQKKEITKPKKLGNTVQKKIFSKSTIEHPPMNDTKTINYREVLSQTLDISETIEKMEEGTILLRMKEKSKQIYYMNLMYNILNYASHTNNSTNSLIDFFDNIIKFMDYDSLMKCRFLNSFFYEACSKNIKCVKFNSNFDNFSLFIKTFDKLESIEIDFEINKNQYKTIENKLSNLKIIRVQNIDIETLEYLVITKFVYISNYKNYYNVMMENIKRNNKYKQLIIDKTVSYEFYNYVIKIVNGPLTEIDQDFLQKSKLILNQHFYNSGNLISEYTNLMKKENTTILKRLENLGFNKTKFIISDYGSAWLYYYMRTNNKNMIKYILNEDIMSALQITLKFRLVMNHLILSDNLGGIQTILSLGYNIYNYVMSEDALKVYLSRISKDIGCVKLLNDLGFFQIVKNKYLEDMICSLFYLNGKNDILYNLYCFSNLNDIKNIIRLCFFSLLPKLLKEEKYDTICCCCYFGINMRFIMNCNATINYFYGILMDQTISEDQTIMKIKSLVCNGFNIMIEKNTKRFENFVKNIYLNGKLTDKIIEYLNFSNSF